MSILRAQVIIPATSTVSEDAVTNTWHFNVTGDEETTAANITSDLAAFYEAMDTYKSDLQSWTTNRVKWFNMSDPEPRVPILDTTMSLTGASSSQSLPHEVTAVLSFHGTYASGASQARRRGRIYFGPLNTTVMTDSGHFASAFCTALATAGDVLLATSVADTDYDWAVYSPTAGLSYPVVGGWVDNAPDIQRRRGFRATSRTLFS